MKKFIYVLMWVQLIFTITNFFGGSLVDELFDFPEYFTILNIGNDINILIALYIAWRVTPESKQ